MTITTLTSAPVAPLLKRLFAEAEERDSTISQTFAHISKDEQDRLLRSRNDYLTLYTLFRENPLAVSEETGRLLYMLARACNARHIIEFGTSFGISTLHLASALRDNGGGYLLTCEFEPSKIARAREHLEEAGLMPLVEIREGDALTTLKNDLPEHVQLLLLDGAKALYPEVLALVEPHLTVGAFVVADNADFCPEYLAYVRNSENGYLSLPMGDDVELSLYLGRR